MPRYNVCHRFFRPLVAVTAAFAWQLAGAQAPLWSNNWSLPAPPNFPYWQQPVAAFSPDGELLLGAIGNNALDYQFTRLTASGAARWSVNLGNGLEVDAGSLGALLPEADGSAIVAFGDGFVYGSQVARIAADGSVLWLHAVQAKELFPLPNHRVATNICGLVSVLDATTGQFIWQYGAANSYFSECAQHNVAGDDLGNVYATFTYPAPYPVSYGPSEVHTIKFDTNGKIVWERIATLGEAALASLAGVSNGILYETQFGELSALRTGDGSVLWQVPATGEALLIGSPAEPVMVGVDRITRLAADTGIARWSQTFSMYPLIVQAVDDAVLICGGAAILKIDAGSGAIAWQTPLQVMDPGGNTIVYKSAGLMSDGNVVVAGAVVGYAPAPVLQRIGFLTGQPLGLVAAAPVAQGIVSNNIIEDDGHRLDAALTLDAESSTVRLRRLDAATGALLWETSAAVPKYGEVSGLVISGGGVYPPDVVARSANVAAAFAPNNAIWIGMFDRSSGDMRWTSSFSAPFQDYVYASKPALDPDGNVYLSTLAHFSCGQFDYCCPGGATTCAAFMLYKFASADGSILWQKDIAKGYTTASSPQAFALAGSDVLLASPNVAGVSPTLQRLSGSDGTTVMWSSSVLPDYGVYEINPLADGTAVVNGFGWARLDIATGNTLWTSANVTDPNCAQVVCYFYDGLITEAGDLYRVGEGNHTARIERRHGDGSGIADLWYPIPYVPGLRVAATQIRRDAAGNFWLRLSRSGGSPLTLDLLAKFDPVAGTLSDQQVIGSYMYADDLAANIGAAMVAAPENGKLPAQLYSSAPPLPGAESDALLDVSIQAHGDLVVSAASDLSIVAPGSRVNFHFAAMYTGDAPLQGVRLFGSLPWATGLTNVTCATQSASNCSLDIRSDNVDATFDILPGGRVDISGSIIVQDDMQSLLPPRISAAVYGPSTLAEPDTANNIVKKDLTSSLFFDGFE